MDGAHDMFMFESWRNGAQQQVGRVKAELIALNLYT